MVLILDSGTSMWEGMRGTFTAFFKKIYAFKKNPTFQNRFKYITKNVFICTITRSYLYTYKLQIKLTFNNMNNPHKWNKIRKCFKETSYLTLYAWKVGRFVDNSSLANFLDAPVKFYVTDT